MSSGIMWLDRWKGAPHDTGGSRPSLLLSATDFGDVLDPDVAADGHPLPPLPHAFALAPNDPNRFGSSATIPFSLPGPEAAWPPLWIPASPLVCGTALQHREAGGRLQCVGERWGECRSCFCP